MQKGITISKLLADKYVDSSTAWGEFITTVKYLYVYIAQLKYIWLIWGLRIWE